MLQIFRNINSQKNRNLSSRVTCLSGFSVDVLWGQPIKLIQVASISLKLFPLIASGPQKYKHKIVHKYFTFQHPKKLGAFF